MKKLLKKGLALRASTELSRMSERRESNGFTLIELLIVIALLGALAIGLIGALDPFEQLKKGTDTGTRNTVSEVHSAIIRYYALKNFFPWCTDAGACHAFAEAEKLNSVAMTDAIAAIVLTGELKSNFTTMQSGELGKVYVYGADTGTDVTVCYLPGSKSFKSDANTVWTDMKGTKQLVKTGDPATDCTGLGGTKTCYWCVQ